MRDSLVTLSRMFPVDSITSVTIIIICGYVLSSITDFFLIVPIRLITGVLLLSAVPGLLIITSINSEFLFSELAVYSVLLSVLWTGTIGTVEQVAVWLGIFSFTKSGSVVYILSLIGLLLIYRYSNGRQYKPSLSTFFSKKIGVTALLPVMVSLGAYLNLMYSIGMVAKVTLLIIVIVGVLFLSDPPSNGERPIVLYLFSLALLLQRPLSRLYLGGGDSGTELYIARITLITGTWDPTLSVSKASLVLLTVIRPLQGFVTGLSMVDVMRIVHPIQFAIIAPALYLLFREMFDDYIAFASTFVYISLYPFYVILSMNTRTAMAILFFVGFLLVSVQHGSRFWGKALGLLFLCGVIISHYGTALILIFITTVTIVIKWFGDLALWQDEKQVPLELLGIFSVLTIAWQIYTASGHILELIVGIMYNSLSKFGSVLGSSSSAGHGAQRGFSSLTYVLIRFEYIALLILIGTGGLLLTISIANQREWSILQKLPKASIETSVTPFYYSLCGGMAAFAVASIAPVSSMGIARVLIISFVVLLPLAILTIQTIEHRVTSSSHPFSMQFVSIFFALILIIQSGLLGFAMNERTPQPYYEKNRLESGNYPQQSIHYFGYHQTSNVQTANWLLHYRNRNTNILGNGYSQRLPSHYSYRLPIDFSKPPGPYYSLGNKSGRKGNEYVYLSAWTRDTGLITPSLYPSSTNYNKMNFISVKSMNNSTWNTIYTNGNSTVEKL